MHRRLSAVLALLALSLTAALVGAGPAAASILEPPTGTSDSQVDGPDGGDGGGGLGPGSGDPGQPSCDEFTLEPCMSGPDGGGSGGGGYDGLGLPYPDTAVEVIGTIRGAVLNALVNKPRCFNLLSPTDSREPGTLNPISVINTVRINYVNDDTINLGSAAGRGVDGRITILNGFFLANFIELFKPLGYIDTTVYFDLPVVSLSVPDMQIVIMLHELGHLTGVNVHPNDGVQPVTPAELGQDFNTQIYVNCLDQGVAYQ